MSWEVAIVKFNGRFRPIEEVDDDDYQPLGSLVTVEKAIRVAFPKAEWSEDKSSATVDGGKFTIEIDLSQLEDGSTVLMQVRGSGDPIPSILSLTNANRWAAVDCSTSEFIDPADPSYEGWEGYQELNED